MIIGNQLCFCMKLDAAIHCSCSIRIVSWHNRLRRAVMDVNSKQVDPSTAHMLSLFSTRLGSVTPGEHIQSS
jgi:hypothetical protein